MSDQWTDRLSAYIDGELSQEEGAKLEQHLETCDECKATLQQLKAVVGWAEGYPGREPARDQWSDIGAAISGSQPGVVNIATRRGRDRRLVTMPRALAAGIVLALVGAGSWWAARATAPRDQMVMVIDVSSADGGSQISAAINAAKTYGPAIAQLERVFVEQQDSLDARTVTVLREKLAIIDRALAEAQDALARDPNSDYLADHYTGMMKKKLTVLRAATRGQVIRS
jgi:anti-sigma factor RsiW